MSGLEPLQLDGGGHAMADGSGDWFFPLSARTKHEAVLGASVGAIVTLFEMLAGYPWRNQESIAATVSLYLLTCVVNSVVGAYAGAAIGPVFGFLNRFATVSPRSRIVFYVLLCSALGAVIGAATWVKALDERELGGVGSEEISLMWLVRKAIVPMACGAAVGIPVGVLLGTLSQFFHSWTAKRATGRGQSVVPARGTRDPDRGNASTVRARSSERATRHGIGAMADPPLSCGLETLPNAGDSGNVSPAICSPSQGGNGATDGDLGEGRLVFDWWDACQLALVFVLTQYIAGGAAGLLAANLPWPGSGAFALLADQLVLAVFPVAVLFRLQPRALQMFHAPRPSWAEVVALVILSPPLVYLMMVVSRAYTLTCGLPLLASISPSLYGSILGLFVTCVIGPAVEEVFFRGILGRSLILRYGPLLGTLVTAGIFALTRVGSSQVGAAFLLGVACHISYLGTGSITAPILVHALTNCFGPTFKTIDLPLTFQALLAVSAAAYAIGWGRFPSRWVPRPDHPPQSLASPAAVPACKASGTAPLRSFGLTAVVLFAPLPFYAILFYLLEPLVLRWNL
jgi:membrane protease YdiL (CAAX protease family)